MSIFKERKIPKHLIIHDEYEIRKRSRFSFSKLLMWALTLACLGYVVAITRL